MSCGFAAVGDGAAVVAKAGLLLNHFEAAVVVECVYVSRARSTVGIEFFNERAPGLVVSRFRRARRKMR